MAEPRNPIEMLTHEHHYIKKVVAALRTIGDRLQGDSEPNVDQLRRIVRFMREFADRCHHGKEEDLLFPAMEEKGVPESGCPLGALRNDHMHGRKLVTSLREGTESYAAGDRSALQQIRSAIDGICELYPNHIWREDEMVFPMASRIFTQDELADLRRRFETVEEEIGQEHEVFAKFAEELEQLVRA
jgi:hemerythrin-like domain-containing protein